VKLQALTAHRRVAYTVAYPKRPRQVRPVILTLPGWSMRGRRCPRRSGQASWRWSEPWRRRTRRPQGSDRSVQGNSV